MTKLRNPAVAGLDDPLFGVGRRAHTAALCVLVWLAVIAASGCGPADVDPDHPSAGHDTEHAGLHISLDETRTTAVLRRELHELSDDTTRIRVEVLFEADVDNARAIAALVAADAQPLENGLRYGGVIYAYAHAAAVAKLIEDPSVVVVAESPPENVSRHEPSKDDAGPDTVPFNAESRRTSNAHRVAPGGAMGLDLTGEGVVLGIIDGGRIRTSHNDFGGRADYFDSDTAFDSHATHVAGTMVGGGIIRADATGFAPSARLLGWNFNRDTIDLMVQVHRRFVASNHSYGFDLGWDRNGRWVGDEGFGKYSLSARRADQAIWEFDIIWIKAAGNDRGQGFDRATPSRPWDCSTGYDCLPGDSAAKNMIVVASIADLPAGAVEPGSAVASSFSSRGPADDGRIKPDIAANGESLLSTGHNGDSAYVRLTGTSMAAPSVAGGVALLAELYRDRFGREPGSAEIRGLLIHTALRNDLLGRPNAILGWGVMDLEAAARHVLRQEEALVTAHGVYTGAPHTFTLQVAAPEEVALTLVWNDPPGSVNTGPKDDRTPALVHDLDLRAAQGGSVFYPWRLNAEDPGANARNNAPNRVDNIERIVIPASQVTSGLMTITIDHNGSLTHGSQPYVLFSSAPVVAGQTQPLLGGVHTLRVRAENDEPDRTVAVPLTLIQGASAGYALTVQGAPSWLSLSRTSGSLPAQPPQMTINALGLSPGVYYATVVATNTTTTTQPPVRMTVMLDVRGLDFPTVDAGNDLTVASGSVARLRGSGSDPGGDPVTFSWRQTAGPSVTLSSSTSATPTFIAPTVESPTTIRFELVVQGTSLTSAPDAVEVTVIPIVGADEPMNNRCETAPLVTLPYYGGGILDVRHDVDFFRFQVDEGERITARTYQRGAAIDTTMALTRLDNSAIVIDDDGGTGLYSRISTVTDSEQDLCIAVSTFADFTFDGADARTGGEFGLTIEIDRPNVPPIANAGDDVSVDAGALGSLDGRGSEDPDGYTLAFQWTQVAGSPSVALDDASSPTPRFIAPREVSSPLELTYRLTVTDADGATDTDTTRVFIDSGTRTGPIVDAGPDRTVPEGALVRLLGRVDGDDEVILLWEQMDGELVDLYATATLETSFVAPWTDDPRTLEFRLSATDDDESDSATVRVHVIPTVGDSEPENNRCETAPLIGRSAILPVLETIYAELEPQHDVDHYRIAVLEDSLFDIEVLPNGPPLDTTMGVYRLVDDAWDLRAVDDDSGTNALSRISARSASEGELCIAISHFRDFTFDGANADGAGPYALRIQVTPPEGANTPPVADAGEDQTVEPGALVSLDGSGSFDPDDQPLEYLWEMIDGSRSVDIFDPVREIAQVIMPNDLSELQTFTFALTVFDGGLYDTATVEISVHPNAPPVFEPKAAIEADLGEVIAFTIQAEDPDGDDVRYVAEEMPATATFDPETRAFSWETDRAGFFTPRFEAIDPYGAFDEIFVTILVIDRAAENRPPSIVQPEDVTITTDVVPVVVPLSVSASDPDGDDIDIIWQLVDGTLLGAGSSIAPSFEFGIHQIEIFASDGRATSSARFRVTVRPDSATPPVADAGAPQEYRARRDGDPPVIIPLDGRLSHDPEERGELRWSWTQTSGPAVALDDPTRPVPSFDQPDGEAFLVFELEVTVESEGGGIVSEPDSVSVRLANDVTNARPGALIQGPDTASTGTTERYDGSLSEDPEGEPLEFRWSLERGAGALSSIDATAIDVAFGSSDEGLWELLLLVYDGVAYSRPARLAISEGTAVTNRRPVAVAALDGEPVRGRTIILDASASSDPDGDPLTFEWSQTSGPAVEVVTPNEAVASATLDTSPGMRLAFRVIVSDGELSDTAEVTFVVRSTVDQDAGHDAGETPADIDTDGADDAESVDGRERGKQGGCSATSHSRARPLWALLPLLMLTSRRWIRRHGNAR